MTRKPGRVPVELGVAAAQMLFSLALRREVDFFTDDPHDIARRIHLATWEVYTKYLRDPQKIQAWAHASERREEAKQLLLAAAAFFVGVALLQSFYNMDAFARWLVGEYRADELSA